jgi:hypothetical protein
MKYLYIFLLMPFLGFSQVCPVDTNYLSPNVMPNEPGLDWRVYQKPNGEYVAFANGNVWIDNDDPPGGPPTQGDFPNPFIDYNNSNVSALAEMPYDYEDDDGWISKRLGDSTGTGPLHVTHPVYVMYNRFTATMRVFVLVTHREDDYTTKSVVYLNWDNSLNSNKIGSAVLSHIESPMNALNTFNQDTTLQQFIKPNIFGSNDSYYWI